ncbi:EAL domain-containing protein [Methylobacterium sp. BTF04]|uniref:putative bifunctional diguanylate cyclase/phosphodiesterase n=1 Tax=Methylobacterium sp. BTF04 TaxID=2708300 RepID=UPI0013CF659F|nr:EAL domain-containing protein [Methylobacterium sp. BTF04]NEU12061.1 EAL domain-containing protein [Methylobacterium sp. BTF04]
MPDIYRYIRLYSRLILDKNRLNLCIIPSIHKFIHQTICISSPLPPAGKIFFMFLAAYWGGLVVRIIFRHGEQVARTMSRQSQTIESLVMRDQLSAVHHALFTTLISNVFVSFCLTFMMWPSVDHRFLLAWVGSNAVYNAIRISLASYWWRSGTSERHPDRVLRYLTIGAFFSGLSWTVGLIGIAIAGQAYTIATGLAFCGITAGAVIESRAHRGVVPAFVLPSNLVLILLYASADLIASRVIAMNLLLLFVMMVRSTSKTERHFKDSTRLKYEATHLAESLQAANVVATQAVHRLEYVANHDHLTGLANRVAYQKAFDQFLTRSSSGEGDVTVMLIDLDHFKEINDTLGHAEGDEALIEVARRLNSLLTPDDLIARLGGDEFAALIFRPRMEAEDEAIAATIVDRLREPFRLSDRAWQAGASVGFARFPKDGATMKDLQVCADIALYHAKSAGRSTWCAFSDDMRRETVTRQRIGRDLTLAVDEGRIEVWFQPQVDSRTGKVCGLEALLRWKHHELGWLSPPDVVKAAAATRQSERLTRAVFQGVCRMAQVLAQLGRPDIVVSLNVSPDEFGTYRVADMIAEELTTHRIAPTSIAVEITEEAVYSTERGGDDLAALRRMGVRIIVDDFGVAYSSIGSLRTINFDGIKIDKSFIQDVGGDHKDRRLTGAIFAFAQSLGVDVVAEGIETKAQAEILTGLGCPVLQGYYFARPMPQTQTLAWITQNAITAPITATGTTENYPSIRAIA